MDLNRRPLSDDIQSKISISVYELSNSISDSTVNNLQPLYKKMDNRTIDKYKSIFNFDLDETCICSIANFEKEWKQRDARPFIF